MLKASIYKRCGCKSPDTGKPLNQNCPRLSERRHGTWTLDTRIPTTDKGSRRYKRSGFETKTAAENAQKKVGELLDLAGDDDRMAARIGDLIFTRTKRKGDGGLPTAAELRRRLGAGVDVQSAPVTVAEGLTDWYEAKRKAWKKSHREGVGRHIQYYLVPLLGQYPRDQLRPAHIVGMFDTIDEWTEHVKAGYQAQRAKGVRVGRHKHPPPPGDVRKRPCPVGVNTQHKILETLNTAYTWFVDQPGGVDWNPCKAVELPPRTRTERPVWSPEQAGAFLEEADQDRLGLLYRMAVLSGPRRGEVCGLRWLDLDDDDTGATIRQTLLVDADGDLYYDTPKTPSGERWMAFDAGTVERIAQHRTRQKRERLAAGELWTDHGLVFCREDGSPVYPYQVSWGFQEVAARAGVPVIRFHDGRHTAATLGLEAGLDIKVVSAMLGHSTTAITQDLYTHVRRAVQGDAAAAVLNLVESKRKRGKETGS